MFGFGKSSPPQAVPVMPVTARLARLSAPINLGDKVRDCITGFEGVVTGRAVYITGCAQFLVVPQTRKPDGEPNEARWFDVDRLEPLGGSVILPRRTSNGPDKPAPIK